MILCLSSLLLEIVTLFQHTKFTKNPRHHLLLRGTIPNISIINPVHTRFLRQHQYTVKTRYIFTCKFHQTNIMLEHQQITNMHFFCSYHIGVFLQIIFMSETIGIQCISLSTLVIGVCVHDKPFTQIF